MVLFLVPIWVAGAFFSFSSAGGVDVASNQVKTQKILNSQNIDLLKTSGQIDPDLAKGGGDIQIVDDSALLAESGVIGTSLDIEKAKNSDRISLYEVREGDALSQIAEMFDVSVNTIRWANELTGPIRPGQQLVILPVTGVKHVVKNGGTLADLAKIYHGDVNEIALYNGLSVDAVLKPGDEVIVPNADVHDHEDEEKDKKSGKSSGTATRLTFSTPSQSYDGYYANPLPGAILTQNLHGYNGVDFGAPYGTPIYASASGKVITSKEGGWNGGYGNLIVISHDNGTQTLYSHMSSNAVYVGQKVKAGQVIGYVGSTGKSTGNHLHFEIRGAKNPFTACSVGRSCK